MKLCQTNDLTGLVSCVHRPLGIEGLSTSFRHLVLKVEQPRLLGFEGFCFLPATFASNVVSSNSHLVLLARGQVCDSKRSLASSNFLGCCFPGAPRPAEPFAYLNNEFRRFKRCYKEEDEMEHCRAHPFRVTLLYFLLSLSLVCFGVCGDTPPLPFFISLSPPFLHTHAHTYTTILYLPFTIIDTANRRCQTF